MTAYQFAVLRYMPDALRQETLNVGVVVAPPEGGAPVVRVLTKSEAARLKWLGFEDDIDFLHDLERDLSLTSPESTAADILRSAYQEWGGTVRVSELRAAIHDDPRALCEDLYSRYVANPRTKLRSTYRDRVVARRIVKKALGARFPERVLRTRPAVQGKFEEHKFDFGLQNGSLVHAVAAFSFDQRRPALQLEVDACAWAINDVRKVHDTLPVTVVTIGARQDQLLDRAQAIYESLGARLIREAQIDDWARGMASQLESLVAAPAASPGAR